MVYFALQHECSTAWVPYYEEHVDGIQLQIMSTLHLPVRVTVYQECDTQCDMYDITGAVTSYPHGCVSLYKYEDGFTVHINNKLVKMVKTRQEYKIFVKIQRIPSHHDQQSRLLLVRLSSPYFFRSPPVVDTVQNDPVLHL